MANEELIKKQEQTHPIKVKETSYYVKSKNQFGGESTISKKRNANLIVDVDYVNKDSLKIISKYRKTREVNVNKDGDDERISIYPLTMAEAKSLANQLAKKGMFDTRWFDANSGESGTL